MPGIFKKCKIREVNKAFKILHIDQDMCIPEWRNCSDTIMYVKMLKNSTPGEIF